MSEPTPPAPLPPEPPPPAPPNTPAQTAAAAPSPATQHLSFQATFSNVPIPAPDLLRGYESMSPGAAQQLIRMAEDEGKHRRAMERKRLEAEIADQRAQRDENRRSQWLSVLAVVVCVAGGTCAAIWGSAVAGGVIGTLGAAAVAGAVAGGRSRGAKG